MSREGEVKSRRAAVEPGDAAVLAEAVRSLGHAVLVRAQGEEDTAREAFEIVGEAPNWWGVWMAGAKSILERSPFLEDFVSGEARDFWENPEAAGILRSGFWEEAPTVSAPGETGRVAPRFFEAIAARTGSGAALLLIEPADKRLKRERQYQQSAHDLHLDRRRLQKELENKQILLECITHDLGNPLAAMLLNLQNVSRELEDRPTVQSTVQRAIGQLKRQSDLIRSISEVFAADLTAIRTPNADGSEPPDLVATVAEVLSGCAPSALERSVTLCPFFTSPLPVVADRLYLNRLIENLIQNGIRHSPDGGTVMIKFERKDGFAVCRFEDQGPGIDPEEIDWIFEPFAKGRSGREGQSGLGLYFCRLTAKMWGGRIEVWNRPEGGACFEVWLPRSGVATAGGNAGAES